MDYSSLVEPPFGGTKPLDWDFNVAVGPTSVPLSEQGAGGLSMDIDSWSAVCFHGMRLM